MTRGRVKTRRAPPAAPRPEYRFAARLIAWQRRHGRHDLPWQGTRDAYRIWLSEIMLQQTQVATVVPYYQRFLARFPDLPSLARADLEDVLRLWAGLGYYSRARNLHRAARVLASESGGLFPRHREDLERLPGVGRSTAAAIAVFAYGVREAILDGNVKRVLARHFAIRGFPGDRLVESKLWALAASLLPERAIERYTQALMDLGASVCRRTAPACAQCPLRATCEAKSGNSVHAYPAPRPRRPVPLRATTMLVLVRGARVMLEKRPPAGIWGGLWSLPEMPAEGDLKAHCAARFACEVGATDEYANLRHAFTHFTLDIRAIRCEVRRIVPGARESALTWHDIDEAANEAVPAPVKKLLRRIATAPHPRDEPGGAVRPGKSRGVWARPRRLRAAAGPRRRERR
jgi:A/G-specific adenine glycosylase